MKKLLLTLIVSIAFCGSIFAQYETHWHDFDYHAYQDQKNIVGFVQIGENFLTNDDNYEAYEMAFFVNGSCRGHEFVWNEYGDIYPVIDLAVYYSTPDEVIDSIVLFDHENNIEYPLCTINWLEDGVVTLWDGELLTGEDHYEQYDMLDGGLVFSFSLPVQEGYILEIDAYEGAKDHYYLIASPVGGIAAKNVTGLRTPAFDLYSFNPAGTEGDGLEWVNHRDEENYELQPGVGYLYANNSGTDLTFNGTALEGEMMEYTYTIAEAGEGLDFPDWNLVGNPFAETVTVNVPFLTMNDLGTDYVTNDEGGELPAMTGAFVHGVTSVAFTKAATGKKTSRLDLNLSNNRGLIDRAIVSFSQGQQMPKFQLRDSNTKVYIPMDGNDYSLVRSEGMGELPVNFKAETSGSYTLSFNAEEVSFGYLHLIDNMTGADVDLLQTPSYSFSASSTDYASRFKLVFATGSANDDNFAFYSNGSLVINNEGNATVQVIDVTGRIISSETIEGCANVNVNAAPGVYMIRLVNGDNMKVQKMVVR